MTTNQTLNIFFALSVISALSLTTFTSCIQAVDAKDTEEYIVAAYVWPSCHDEQRSRDALWGEGTGEWEIIKKADPGFEGHYQPRVPLWGYKMDDDPKAWEQKIDAAISHGVNTFIFDWYWFGGKPFLEEAINEGFLGAANNEKANFYLMWANHDASGYQWNHYRYKPDTILWHGEVDWDNYKIVVSRVIKQYFQHNNYLKFDNNPVFSIYSIDELVQSFNGLEGTKKALDYFRQEVKTAGFSGLHLQVISYGRNGEPSLLREKNSEGKSINEIISMLGINSITTYHWAGILEDYLKWGSREISLWAKWDSALTIPYFPNASVGYDDTPRFPERGKDMVVHYHNTPESFAAFLQKAKEYADNHPSQPKLITINAWNEWVEGSYLEPDMRWGYGYLEAVKKVMCGELNQ
jgi:hypothetical protein